MNMNDGMPHTTVVDGTLDMRGISICVLDNAICSRAARMMSDDMNAIKDRENDCWVPCKHIDDSKNKYYNILRYARSLIYTDDAPTEVPNDIIDLAPAVIDRYIRHAAMLIGGKIATL